MTDRTSPVNRRMLLGGVAGLVGVGLIGLARAFPAVTAPQALPVGSGTPVATSPAVPVHPSHTGVTASPVTTSPATPTHSRGPMELPNSAPVRVRIPSIGVDSTTVALGLDGNELETPTNPDEIGWFVGAKTPGARGRAVLAGHLTWNGQDAVFARLPHVAVGAVVEVDREDGITARFQITRLATFTKDKFPTHEVYASTDEPTLVLITCGGGYSASQHYYDSNVIAFASALGGE